MSVARPLAVLCRVAIASGIVLGTMAIPGLPAAARASDAGVAWDAGAGGFQGDADLGDPSPSPTLAPSGSPTSSTSPDTSPSPTVPPDPTATPAASPDATASPTVAPDATASAAASPAPPSATPSLGPTPSPPASIDPGATPSPSPSENPTPSASASADPSPNPSPTPSATPTPPPTAPPSLNLFVASGFRYQDPNYSACAAASAQDMLNFIALTGSGGDTFRWRPSVSNATRDAVLAFERGHDTLATTSRGTDPHGWRNALNYFGWGSTALQPAQMVYKDVRYSSYSDAIHAAVRQMVLTRKPVGILGWAGHHAQMLTGYYGLRGDPLARRADGSWSNAFSVSGLYITDPLRSDVLVNRRVGYSYLATTTNLRLRFRPYYQTDSPYDDRYTPGYRVSRTEWYGGFVVLLPVR